MSTFWPCETATMTDKESCRCPGEPHLVGTPREIQLQKDLRAFEEFSKIYHQHPPKAPIP